MKIIINNSSEEQDIIKNKLNNNKQNINMSHKTVENYKGFSIKSLNEFKKIASQYLSDYFNDPYDLIHPEILVHYNKINKTYDVFNIENKTVCIIEDKKVEEIKNNFYNISSEIQNVFEFSSTIDFELFGLTNKNSNNTDNIYNEIHIEINLKSNKNIFKIIMSYDGLNDKTTIDSTCILMYLSERDLK